MNKELEKQEEVIKQDIKQLKKEIEDYKDVAKKMESEIEDYKDVTKRLQADFENYIKRIEKEKDIIKRNTEISFIKNFIPIIETIEKASEKNKEILPLMEQTKQIMKSIELEEIENKYFNPEKHEAIMTEKKTEKDGEILEIFQKGYTYKGYVVKPSKVKVNLRGVDND